MQVNSEILQQALLRALRCASADRAEGLPLDELARAWRETGLRGGDLDAVLRDLQHKGLLRLVPGPEGARLQLAPQTVEQLAQTAPTVEGYANQVVARANLFRLARRRRAARPGRGRRSQEAVPPRSN